LNKFKLRLYSGTQKNNIEQIKFIKTLNSLIKL
jgi:hypothetical protein